MNKKYNNTKSIEMLIDWFDLNRIVMSIKMPSIFFCVNGLDTVILVIGFILF